MVSVLDFSYYELNPDQIMIESHIYDNVEQQMILAYIFEDQ